MEHAFDAVVIGGGSGGLAFAKAAASRGAKVAVLDFVQPSPHGTSWGLGGTCVNVGCIPKKLFHQAALLGHALEDAPSFGWSVHRPAAVDWDKLRTGVQEHIRALNWGYRVALRDKGATYINAYGTLLDAHTVKTVNKRGVEASLGATYIVLAPGGRPRYPDIPGAKAHGISSDDLFSLERAPGRTLVVGASYVALECAGFLTSLGFDTTVMVRSILLRGFDQQCATKIGEYMERVGTKFVRNATPTKLEKLEGGAISATFEQDGQLCTDIFDTVLFAIGRDPCTTNMGLEAVGVQLDSSSGKIVHGADERTTVNNIFALGDVLHGKPELTPVAIQAGKLLAGRLFGGSQQLVDYDKICTTVYTPLEYGCCGLAEEEAVRCFGEDNVEVYHQAFTPLEWTVPHRPENVCYAKLVCNKADDGRVVGLHFLGPNAGEVTQGFGMALMLKATKAQFDALIGIHPTVAETFTTLSVSKSSGISEMSSGC